MTKFACLAVVTFLAACSSGGAGSPSLGGDSGGGGVVGSSCEQAKQVSDECKAKQADSGVSINFDLAKCESGGAGAQAAAQCIVNNRSNCDCLLACAIQGSCS